MIRKIDIKEVIIVEGKSDTNKIQKLFNVDTYETGGSALNKNKIDFIRKLAKSKGVILFFDPDYAGEKIRNILIREIPNSKNCFLDIKTSFDVKAKKKGLAEAKDESVIEALKLVATFDNTNQSISWDEYLLLNIKTKNQRNIICNYLNISLVNNKQLFKRLNMLNIDYKTCKNILVKNNL
ncbi:MAG: ribonuclease M5 [Malacoplasma sp.]